MMNSNNLAKRFTLYVVVVGIALLILVPLYFLIMLSFLSSNEAYKFPLPLVPAVVIDFEVSPYDPEAGNYTLSIYNKQTEEYESVAAGTDPERFSTYMRTNLNVLMSPDEIQEEMNRADAAGQAVEFSHTKSPLQNYVVFFTVTRDAVPSLIRSIEVAAMTIFISLSIGSIAGYAFARYAFKGKETLKIGVLFVRMFPAVAIAIPMVSILTSMGLYDNPLGLSLVYAVNNIGLTVWITMSLFMSIPVTLEEAGKVFGCTPAQTIWRITLPLALPGLAASAMYAFIGAWTETVSALILTQFNPTFAVVVYQTLIGTTGQVNLTAAGAIALAIPALIFTLFIRKYINQMWGDVSVS
jgi:multiple sugar transport system permease protein